MAKLDVLDKSNKKVKTVQLDDSVVSSDVNEGLLYSAVCWQRACMRSGNASTKTRGEVKHSTAKPFRQKGTGRARQGMTSSPLLLGGGTVFGPKPRSYSYKFNKKMLQGAIRSAISMKFQEGKVKVIDTFKLEQIKTKEVVNLLKNLKLDNVLLIDEENENLFRSVSNMRNVKYLPVNALNVYDLLKYDTVLFSEASLSSLERFKKIAKVSEKAK